jgi:signal transduction histidine kinase/ActR/RegA family two-component response regulator
LAPFVFEPVQIRLKAPITQIAPLTASRLTAAIATTVLTGWIVQIDLLKNFAPGMIAMNPITASGLIAASVALFLRQAAEASRKRTILGQALAAGVIVVGGCSLLLSSYDQGVAKWLTMPHLSDGSLVEANGARISLSFVLIGTSLLALNYKTARGFRPGELACAVTAIIAILSLVAHAHYLIALYTTATYTPASLLTSVCFFLLATGILLARADRGTLAIIVSETAAGMLARWLIPLAILLPILIGAIRQGVERAGLYDPTFGAAHSATTFMVLFFAAIWWTTRMVFHIDSDRIVAEQAQQKQEQQVHRLNIEKMAAEKANKAKDDFLAVLSHELRTPLTPALAAASYLADHEDLSPQLREEVTAIRTSVRLEARLIDDLLDLTRITRGKIEFHLEVADVHSLLRNSLEIARDNILEKHLDLVVNFGADRHHVWADAIRLQQVFWNLLNNAVKFSKKSGRITMRTTNEDGRFVFQITDTGVGIEPEQQNRVFHAFEQGEPAISRKFGGLGLGLAISKRLLELQGGTISVHSEGLNRGASFKLSLATVDSPKVATVSHSITDKGPARSLQLLVVDDHPQTLRVLASLLRKQGHKVLTAECVQAAIKLLEDERFDGLISDIGLPDGNGCDVMRAAKARQSLVGIALSGFGMEEDVRRSLDAGFDHHLTKPIDFQELERFVGAMALRTDDS